MILEIEERLVEKIRNITNTDYEYKSLGIPYEEIKPMLEDLIYEIEKRDEELGHDINYDPESNWKGIDPFDEQKENEFQNE